RALVLLGHLAVLQRRLRVLVTEEDQSVHVGLLRRRRRRQEARGPQQRRRRRRGDPGGHVVRVPARALVLGAGAGLGVGGARGRTARRRRPEARRRWRLPAQLAGRLVTVGARGSRRGSRRRQASEPLLDVGAVGGVGRLAQVMPVRLHGLGG